MEQPEGVGEHKINHRERVGFARRVRAEEDRFARLDIPIAILAPEETVERLCRRAEVVGGQGFADFADGAVELEQNPFVVAA